MNIKCFLFSFKGRINRQPFWAFTLCALLLWLILSLLLGIDITKRGNPKKLIPMFILLWPSLAVQAKRWHDRDKSAWWILINIVPIAGPIWALVENGCLSGTKGENRFGEDPMGRVSKEPVTDENIYTNKTIPTSEWKPQKYYLSTLMKALIILACVTVILSSAVFLMVGKLTAVEFPGGILPFAIIDTAFIGVIIWRLKAPLVELSETGIKVGIPFLFKTNNAKWDEIEAMVIGETSIFGIKERNIKLLLKSEKGSTKEMLVSLKAVEKPDEIIEKLRIKIPEKGYEDIKQSAVLQEPFIKKEIKYRGWVLTESGLRKGKETIKWDGIKELKYAGLVMAGYGATTISYTSYTENGVTKKNVTVQPSSSEQYLDFIKYLLQHSTKASIDPSFLKAIEYNPKDARADMLALMFFLIGIILFFITVTVIVYYSPTIISSNIYPLIIAPLALIPFLMSIKVLVGRFRGKAEHASKKLLWTGLFNGGLLCSLIVYFILSPYSFYWLIGDIHRKLNNLEQTETYYRAAIESIPDGIDVLYELGTVYMKKKDYEKAFECLKKAYLKDPKYWGPDAVVLLPETLMKMGRHDEALDWCKRILKDQAGDVEIASEINKKQDEIIREKELNK